MMLGLTTYHSLFGRLEIHSPTQSDSRTQSLFPHVDGLLQLVHCGPGLFSVGGVFCEVLREAFHAIVVHIQHQYVKDKCECIG
jgi:hypothetical protein